MFTCNWHILCIYPVQCVISLPGYSVLWLEEAAYLSTRIYIILQISIFILHIWHLQLLLTIVLCVYMYLNVHACLWTCAQGHVFVCVVCTNNVTIFHSRKSNSVISIWMHLFHFLPHVLGIIVISKTFSLLVVVMCFLAWLVCIIVSKLWEQFLWGTSADWSGFKCLWYLKVLEV